MDTTTTAGAAARLWEHVLEREQPPQTGLKGLTLGLVGVGETACELARRAHAAEMTVLAWSCNLADGRAAAVGAQLVDAGELFARADVVSLHLRSTDDCRCRISADLLHRLPEGALLLSAGPTELIDAGALQNLLSTGRLSGFAAVGTESASPAQEATPEVA